MAYLLGTSYPTFTVTSSTSAPDTPASYAALATRPFLPWRSNSIALDGDLAWLDVQFAAATPLVGIFVHNVNVTRLTFQASANGSSWSDLGAQTIPVDTRFNRRKAYLRLTGFNHKFLRLLFDVAYYTEADEEGFGGDPGRFRCGAFVPIGSTTALTIHAPVWPRDFLRDEATEVVGYVGGGLEVHAQGPPRARFFLYLRGARNTTGLTEAALFSALDAATPFLLAEDFGHPERAYYVRRVEDDVLREDFPLLERERFVVEEVI